MKYKLNGAELSIPLAVSCVEDKILEFQEDFENGAYKTIQELLTTKHELYRDVLIAIKGRAAHSAELAAAALKLEDVL